MLKERVVLKYRVYVTYYPGIDPEDVECYYADSYYDAIDKLEKDRKVSMITIYPNYGYKEEKLFYDSI